MSTVGFAFLIFVLQMLTDRLLILDRDGVINADSEAYIKSTDEWEPLPGSIEAIARLSNKGYLIAIASNQSGLARGLFSHSELNAMHRKLRDLVSEQGGRIEIIAFCPHAPGDHCPCRKPRPGLLLEIARRLGIGLIGAPFVGDSLSDLESARAVGMLPWLVKSGKGADTLYAGGDRLEGVRVFEDLGAVADHLLSSV